MDGWMLLYQAQEYFWRGSFMFANQYGEVICVQPFLYSWLSVNNPKLANDACLHNGEMLHCLWGSKSGWVRRDAHNGTTSKWHVLSQTLSWDFRTYDRGFLWFDIYRRSRMCMLFLSEECPCYQCSWTAESQPGQVVVLRCDIHVSGIYFFVTQCSQDSREVWEPNGLQGMTLHSINTRVLSRWCQSQSQLY